MPYIGSRGLRDCARDLQRAGSPAGLSRRMRRQIIASAQPLKAQVQANALAIPSAGTGSTGLRAALAAAVRISVTPMARRTAAVRLIVDGKKMPSFQSSLPAYEEGSDGYRRTNWRHPLFGQDHWYPQASHPFVAPAVPGYVPQAVAAIATAVDETINTLRR